MKAQEHSSQPLRSPVPAPLHIAEGSMPAASAAFLMRPAYLPASAWTEHLPFAFWMVETLRPRSLVELGTHWGASYFGFCQAVSRFGTNTACYAVDTWQGDEQAGLYGEEVFQLVRDHNRKNYSGFSSLIRSTFDEALPYFPDGGIDLLHIDGLHTYEAVRADFESWLPKLSDRAVVLMHDTNVRERDFGVFRYFAELRERYPGFEFLHGHGLGVVGVGSDLPDGMRALFDAGGSAEKTQGIRRLFAHLGENCQDRLSLTKLEADTQRLEGIIGTTRERVKTLEERLVSQQESLSAKAKELGGTVARLQDELQAERTAAAAARDESERLSAEARELGGTVARLQDELQAERTAAAAARDESERLSAEISEVIGLLAEAPAGQGGVEQPQTLTEAAAILLVELQAQRDAAGELAALREQLGEERARTAGLQAELQELRKLASELTSLRKSHVQEQEQAARTASDNNRLNSELGELTRRLAQAQQDGETARQALKDTRQATDEMGRRFRKLEAQVKAERIAAKERIGTILENTQRLVRAFAPSQPSGVRVAMSPALKALVRRVRAAGVIDDAWYLKKHPDVREAGLDPSRHYVLYGAAEARLPRDMAKPVE